MATISHAMSERGPDRAHVFSLDDRVSLVVATGTTLEKSVDPFGSVARKFFSAFNLKGEVRSKPLGVFDVLPGKFQDALELLIFSQEFEKATFFLTRQDLSIVDTDKVVANVPVAIVPLEKLNLYVVHLGEEDAP